MSTLFRVHLVSFKSQNLQRTTFAQALYNGAVWVRQMEISSVLMTINVPSAMPPYNARLSNGFFAILVANSPVMDSTQDSDSFTIIENPPQIRNWYTDRDNVEDSY